MTNRLKSLELQGYKTFASKSVFEFPGQVTVIVGPNGSGKSNIADGIRWVLGEQAYSLLRGKKTVDMIFFGSEQRSRASMASVSITFDNHDGWLPVDFTEVALTRRAYRSGENEYLLNNQRVRLKEINELLANSGLGERTYTIIGQGLVDSSLSLRPEEKRRFFEEAAGIGLYRGRREEAIQKMDRTLRNIERVADILGELGPRLGSLQKSMDKTIQYNQMRADLEILLKDWYGFQWKEVKEILRIGTEFYNSQKEKMDIRSAEKEAIEERLNRLQNSLNSNREKLANYHKELAEYHKRKEEINRETAVLDEREKSNLQRIYELNSIISSIESEIGLSRNEFEILGQSGEKFEQEFITAKNSLETAQFDLKEKTDEQKNIETNISAAREEILRIESLILEVASVRKNNLAEIEKKNYEIKNLEKHIQQISNDLNQYKININTNKEKTDVLGQTCSNRKGKLQVILTQRDGLDQKIENFETQIKIKEIQLSKLRAELSILEEEQANLSGFSSGSAEIIKAAKERRLEGKFSLIAHQIIIPEKYEIAIAAALGEVLEGVLIDSGINPVKTLKFLEDNKTARTVLVPEDWISKPFINETKFPNHTYAADIIKSNGARSDQIKNLLRGTIIVRDSKTALDIYSELSPGWKIVTLDGVVFDSRGTITAGYEYRAIQLKRKRNKNTLIDEIGSFEKEANGVLQSLKDLVLKRESVSEKINSLKSKINSDEESLREINLVVYKREIELEQKQQILEKETIRLQEIHSTSAQLAKEISECEENISALNEERNRHEKIVKDIPDKLNVDSIEALRNDVLEWSSQKAVAEQIANQHTQKLQSKQDQLHELTNRITSEKQKLADLQSEIREMDIKKSTLDDENQKINIRIGKLNAFIQPLEEEVESIIGRQGKILKDVDKKRQDFIIAERHTMQAQLRVEKAGDKLDALREKIEEDIGLINTEEDIGFSAPKPLPFEELVAGLPEIEKLPDNLEDQISQKKSFIQRIGPVNPEAQREYAEVSERHQFLSNQLVDLQDAEKDLRKVVAELDSIMEKEFLDTFYKIEKEFSNIFEQLFNGGSARLFIEDPENILESGIDIEATLPGKRKQELALLSGGERSLAAVALIFAALRISPTPFCVLDEVDAMLDETNVVRFGDLLRELSDATQFIVITHNRNTVQLADLLYGVTMGKDSVSQVISLKMDELTEEMVQ